MLATVTKLRPGREPPAPPPPPLDPLAYVPVPKAADDAYRALLGELSRIRPTFSGSFATAARRNDAAIHLDVIARLAGMAAEVLRTVAAHEDQGRVG